MKKNILIAVLLSVGTSLLASIGLILNNLNHQNYVFRQIENASLIQYYENIIPLLSGFPFRAYSICSAEFGKCIWTDFGKSSFIYNSVFWLMFFGTVIFSKSYFAKHKDQAISKE
jgi:hypothetical protein